MKASEITRVKGAIAAIAISIAFLLFMGFGFHVKTAYAESDTASNEPLTAGTIQSLGTQSSDAHWTRLWGSNALETAYKIVREGWKDEQCNTVVVASSDGYWDALSASALAGQLNSPLVLTRPDVLSANAGGLISTLKAENVIVCGGPAAISDDVCKQIRNSASSPGNPDKRLNVRRVYGQDAAGTALAIYKEIESPSDTCIVATAGGYWDALAASPYAFKTKSPIFLTNSSGTDISSATLSAIKNGKFKRILIAGGPAAVSKNVEKKLRSTGTTTKRIYGQTAYDTAAEFANFAANEGMSWENVGIATAHGYWDALSGAALCGRNNSVLLLADDGNTAAAESALKKAGFSGHAYIFGGGAAVSAMVPRAINRSVLHVSDSNDFASRVASPRSDGYSQWRRSIIRDRVDPWLTPKEGLMAIGMTITYMPYYLYHSMATDLYTYGSGDCWASARTMVDICNDLGLRCEIRDASKDKELYNIHFYSPMSLHRNNFIWLNGKQYLFDATPGTSGFIVDWHPAYWKSWTEYHVQPDDTLIWLKEYDYSGR